MITGATGGIGRAVAERFAKAGFHLTLADTTEDKLKRLAAELHGAYGVTCRIYPGDLSDLGYVRSLVDGVSTEGGGVDVLINNAAWRKIETMRTIDPETWEKTLRVCLTAPAFLAKWVGEAMERHKTPGVIINISSVMASRAGGYSPAYLASKGGLESLTYELATLYGPSGIRVVAVSPGNIDSGLNRDDPNGYGGQDEPGVHGDQGDQTSLSISGGGLLSDSMNRNTPLRRSGLPHEIAAVCYWLSTPEASFITGTCIVADGGFSHNFNDYSVKKKKFPYEF